MYLSVNSIIKKKDATEGGLIGGFFRFAAGGQIYGITCKHVIANSTNPIVGNALTNVDNVTVGILSHWIILESDIENRAEFALFKPDSEFKCTWTPNDLTFKPDGFAKATLQATADFVSAEGVQHGVITDVNHKVALTFNNTDYKFSCIEIKALPGIQFSKKGHSGGAVYVGKSLLGIILGISKDGSKTYVVPYIDGILTVVDLKLI